MQMILGQRIYYTGDMANVEDFGTVAAIRPPNKWADESYDVLLDDGRRFNAVHGISFDKSPGRRFWPLDEYEADRKQRYDAYVKNAGGVA